MNYNSSNTGAGSGGYLKTVTFSSFTNPGNLQRDLLVAAVLAHHLRSIPDHAKDMRPGIALVTGKYRSETFRLQCETVTVKTPSYQESNKLNENTRLPVGGKGHSGISR